MESSIAHAYAQALLHHIKSKKIAQAVNRNMENFSQLCQQHSIISFLQNPTIHSTHKINLLSKHLSKEYHRTTIQFIQLVLQKNRASHLLNIIESFLHQYQQQHKQQTGYLIAAHTIAEQQKEQLTQLARKIFHIKNLKLEVQIQPDILGGYILHIGDYHLDASIQKKLNDLLQYWQKENV